MTKTKMAVLQLNPIVGDLRKNADEIIKQYDIANANGADIVVAGECSLTGYPIEDLVLRHSFMDAVKAETQRIIDFVNAGTGAALVFGAPSRSPDNTMLFNSAFFVLSSTDIPSGQHVKFHVFHKHELPNYGVFDEKRVFDVGPINSPIRFRGDRIGVMICEDGWFPQVNRVLTVDLADFIIWINGSPYEDGKRLTRRQIMANRMKECGIPMLYVNLVGGQDELVFDGGSFGFDGVTTFEAPEFVAGTFYWETTIISQEHRDIPLLGERITPTDYPLDWDRYTNVDAGDISHIYRAMVLGTRDYIHKQGFNDVVIGYSGGVDSGIVAAIAVDALGADSVTLVSLPSKFSSDGSKDDAYNGAHRLGTEFRTIPIEPIVEMFRLAYTNTVSWDMDYEKPTVSGVLGEKLTGTADENIQARARGTILMAISNQESKMVLTTGNKSEVSVGYSTLYGDMAGGFNPVKDAYKTVVWALCRWRNSLTEEEVKKFGFFGPGNTDVVPEEIIVKPPSAELRENQLDSNSLPVYEDLDAMLMGMIERELSVADIVAEFGFDEAVVRRIRNLLDVAEYKRRQSAPGIKLTSKLHGRERRYPIVNKWRA